MSSDTNAACDTRPQKDCSQYKRAPSPEKQNQLKVTHAMHIPALNGEAATWNDGEARSRTGSAWFVTLYTDL